MGIAARNPIEPEWQFLSLKGHKSPRRNKCVD